MKKWQKNGDIYLAQVYLELCKTSMIVPFYKNHYLLLRKSSIKIFNIILNTSLSSELSQISD